MRKRILKLVVGVLALAAVLLLTIGYFQTWPPMRAQLISTNYFELRDEFIKSARDAGAELTSLPIAAKGPGGEALTIDIAWFGSKAPDKVLLHISGTHGVEGYAGSAIQSAILKDGVKPPGESAIVFIHGVNPWGMAHHRRFNESNVDLNRNFLLNQSEFNGAPEGYRLIEKFLNPKGPPARIDLFYFEAIYNVLRHGFNSLKQAIAGGQYEYPKGIYYGGSKLEESLQHFKQFISENLGTASKLFVIEVHTGLGDSAKDVLFWPYSPTHPKTKWLSELVKEPLASDAPYEGVGFRTPGDLQNEVPKIMPSADFYWILQEFGAYGAVRTLKALRDENRYHQSGGSDLNHWSKQMLVEAFCPGAEDWQRAVITRGKEYFAKMLPLLSEN